MTYVSRGTGHPSPKNSGRLSLFAVIPASVRFYVFVFQVLKSAVFLGMLEPPECQAVDFRR